AAVGVPALGDRIEESGHFGHADSVEIAPCAEVPDGAPEESLGTFDPPVLNPPSLGLLFEVIRHVLGELAALPLAAERAVAPRLVELLEPGRIELRRHVRVLGRADGAERDERLLLAAHIRILAEVGVPAPAGPMVRPSAAFVWG